MANPILEQFLTRPPKLEGGVDLVIDPIDDRHAYIRMWHGQSRATLKACALSVPYPSGLERLLASEPELDAVLVERIPPGLYEAAVRKEIAILDGHGRGRVVAPGFVYVSMPSAGGEQPRPVNRLGVGRSSPFAPRASRIPRILLGHPNNEVRLSGLAAEAQMNAGNVHKILSALQEMGLVERHKDHYGVPDPGSLLEAWADAHRPSKEGFRISANPDEVSALLRDVVEPLGDRAAISGEVAAELLAPYVASARAIVHVREPEAYARVSEQWRESALPFKPSGIRVDLADEQVGWSGKVVDGFRLVGAPQLYVDMYRDRGRGRDAADHVRRQVLGY